MFQKTRDYMGHVCWSYKTLKKLNWDLKSAYFLNSHFIGSLIVSPGVRIRIVDRVTRTVEVRFFGTGDDRSAVYELEKSVYQRLRHFYKIGHPGWEYRRIAGFVCLERKPVIVPVGHGRARRV